MPFPQACAQAKTQREKLELKVIKDAPKVSFADTLLKCKDNISVIQFAKSLCAPARLP